MSDDEESYALHALLKAQTDDDLQLLPSPIAPSVNDLRLLEALRMGNPKRKLSTNSSNFNQKTIESW